MKVNRVESARAMLIERYVIQGVDKMLPPGEIARTLNNCIRTETGRLFDELEVSRLLDIYGFSEYAAWLVANTDSTTDIIKVAHTSTQGEKIHADF